MQQKDQPLNIKIENDLLVISLGVDVLIHAVSHGPYFAGFGENEFVITDKEKFAEEIVSALHLEEEDGTTVIHRAIDKAAEQAVENGCEGVSFND